MASESDVLSEIEVLKSIYLEELRVSRNSTGDWDVSLVLHPSTAEDSLSQFVRLTLTLTLDSQYPASPPCISIHHPRGLSDDKILSVQRCLHKEAQSCLGGPALYQLIEKAKEFLTESNIPYGNCVICLYGFKEEEIFTKTSCYHYFHSYCLGRYIAHSEAEIRERRKEMEEDKTRARADSQELTVVCPVCREPLTYDLEVLLASPAPHFPTLEETTVQAEFRKKWTELQAILERQRERGGVIDPLVESNRFLIHINETPSDPSSLGPALDSPPCQVEPAAPPEPIQLPGSQSQPVSGHSQRRPDPGHKQHSQPRRRRKERSRLLHEKPVELAERVAKLTFCSGPQSTSKGNEVASEGQREAAVLVNAISSEGGVYPSAGSTADGEMHAETRVSKTTASGQPVNPSRGDTVPPPSAPGREQSQRWDRGRRRVPQSLGQQAGQPEERNVKGADHWEAPRDGFHFRGGRGQRGRGSANAHHRGRGPGRGSGRGFSHRGTERVDGWDGDAWKKNEMYVHLNSPE
ncbi:E3 ubiquitin-protein ligase RNF25 [Brienomyrus brachyistius]|uniref:E3 ubiquitin-protein ligase RNF25 n=1 Tax=Brienomyrus brachyistius TaxID=42636 RepID=UPI0020B212ED|nr:E3 ubiquitin-protein ligase RNF25 [Brienomyrus brachyistius]